MTENEICTAANDIAMMYVQKRFDTAMSNADDIIKVNEVSEIAQYYSQIYKIVKATLAENQ